MADQRRILPVVYDLEAPPPQRPLPSAPQLPYSPSNPIFIQPPKRRNRCCSCLCWTIGLFCLLITVLWITAAIILYLTLQPKLPNYYVDHIRVSEVNVASDSGRLSATFAARITATNPNKKIGIYYEQDSNVDVYHAATDAKICGGSMPEFYQGHENRTVLVLPFAGEREDGVELMAAMTEEVEEKGAVLLDLRVKQPVRVDIGKWKLMKVNVLVKCGIYVVAEDPTWIYDSRCKFRLSL